MVGTEQEAIAHAITECAVNGTDWFIADSEMNVVWKIERDTKVDEDDATWPVIVHLRGEPLAADAIAVLTEAAAVQEP